MMLVQNDAEWLTQPGLNGPHWRAWMAHGDLKVYRTGHWYVAAFVGGKLVSTASGEAANEDEGKLRARAVYEAMICTLTEVKT